MSAAMLQCLARRAGVRTLYLRPSDIRSPMRNGCSVRAAAEMIWRARRAVREETAHAAHLRTARASNLASVCPPAALRLAEEVEAVAVVALPFAHIPHARKPVAHVQRLGASDGALSHRLLSQHRETWPRGAGAARRRACSMMRTNVDMNCSRPCLPRECRKASTSSWLQSRPKYATSVSSSCERTSTSGQRACKQRTATGRLRDPGAPPAACLSVERAAALRNQAEQRAHVAQQVERDERQRLVRLGRGRDKYHKVLREASDGLSKRADKRAPVHARSAVPQAAGTPRRWRSAPSRPWGGAAAP